MNAAVLNGTDAPDQITFDALPGSQAILQAHWSTYFTAGDVAGIAAFGMNALRIPIGFWAFNNTDTPYHQGAEYWLDQAIVWAREYGVKVLIDV